MGTVAEAGVTEEVLITKTRGGDLGSFSALVRLHQERAIHIAYSLLGNLEDARDVAQEAFVKAYQGLRRFKGESRFSTWLHRILVNACNDFLRKKKVRGFFQSFSRRESEEGPDLSEQVAAPGPNALNDLLNKELGEAIYRAMEALPSRQRSVFVLRYLEGLSLEEIAVLEGLSVGAVKAHLWQAGQKMKKSLAGYLPDREV